MDTGNIPNYEVLSSLGTFDVNGNVVTFTFTNDPDVETYLLLLTSGWDRLSHSQIQVTL